MLLMAVPKCDLLFYFWVQKDLRRELRSNRQMMILGQHGCTAVWEAHLSVVGELVVIHYYAECPKQMKKEATSFNSISGKELQTSNRPATLINKVADKAWFLKTTTCLGQQDWYKDHVFDITKSILDL